MIPEKEGVIVNLNYQRAYYLLFNDNGELFSTDEYRTNPKFYGDRIIFLDIDGVLNRDGKDENGNHEYFNEGNKKVIKQSEFGDHVMEYINASYKEKSTFNDVNGFNTYEWNIEKKDSTETSCKIVSKYNHFDQSALYIVYSSPHSGCLSHVKKITSLRIYVIVIGCIGSPLNFFLNFGDIKNNDFKL